MDGNSETSFTGGLTCTHTKNDEDKAWWRVDLGKEERVSEVYIVNRDRGNKLANFQIRVGRLPFALYIQRPPLFSFYCPNYLQKKNY